MNYWRRMMTAARLRCPRCREGRLFAGALTMNAACPKCGLKLEPEPGFYLGSVYANYAATVLSTTANGIDFSMGGKTLKSPRNN